MANIKGMGRPEVSADFTDEDIRRIREYHHAVTRGMSFEERKSYYHDGAMVFLSEEKETDNGHVQ